MEGNQKAEYGRLKPFITPGAALGLSIGTSVGWGSFVVTTNLYLLQAGPLGSSIGMAVGALIMLIISWNYHYMMNLYPDCGGTYSYTKNVLGHDYGFLTAWFITLTYAAILWANATSLPLFSKYFLGNMFRFGKMYTLFEYDVYLGEILLTAGAILITGFLLAKTRNVIKTIAALLGAVFSLGIIVCFAAAMIKHEPEFSFDPTFIPDKGELEQILRVASVSSWAFVGFECISHATEEFTFDRKHTFSLLSVSVILTTLLYIFVMALSVTCYPKEFSSWIEYLSNLDKMEGIDALPAFYAADHYMGKTGVAILVTALLAIILSSLVGNMFALSRIIYKTASDGVLPEKFAHLNKVSNPSNAIAAIVLVSCLVPLLGRTTIGWIVDVNMIGATIAYGFISAAVLKKAGETGALREKVTGWASLLIMGAFGVYFLLPDILGGSQMAKESYILFTVWSVLGIIFFRNLLIKDKEGKFGNSIIVWISLILLVLFTSIDWMLQHVSTASREATQLITEYYSKSVTGDAAAEAERFVAKEMMEIRNTNMIATIVVVAFFSISMGVMLNNFMLMRKREKEKDMELGAAKVMATTDSLTGVKNKKAYSDYEKTINDKILKGTAEDFAIAICDVNGLKQVNDTLGHKAGDQYIQKASRIICRSFAHSPVFRIGGDEFLALMTGMDYENRKEIEQSFNEIMEENKKNGEVVVACGISDFDGETDTAVQTVFEHADELMYKRKKELKGSAEVR